MSSDERHALGLGIPRILVQSALLDNLVVALIRDHLEATNAVSRGELAQGKRADISEALEVACL